MKVVSALVVALIASVSNQSYSQDYVEMNSTEVQNTSAPKGPPGSEMIRVNSLIEQIKVTDNLGEAFPEDLSREDVQLAMVDSNPILFTQLPAKVVLQPKAMEKLAKKVYRFDFFIPPKLRGQPAVRNAFKHYSKIYNQNFEKYLEEGRKYLHEGQGTALIHPDYFYDTTFTFIFLLTCAPENNRGGGHPHYPNGFPPGFPFPGQNNQPNPQQVAAHKRKQSFYYFTQLGVFNSQQKDIFVKKHPNFQLPEHCYPSDFLNDETFVQAMAAKFPYGNYIDMAYNRLKSDKFKSMFITKQLERIAQDYDYPKSVNKISAEDMNTDQVQTWFFLNPEVIKSIDKQITFNKVLLENFIKANYQPSRFFSETQKADPTIKELLEKYPNDSEELLKVAREQSLKASEKIKCCGTTVTPSTQMFLSTLPTILMNDGKFHAEVMNKIRTKDEYINEIARISKLPAELKDYVINNCRNMWEVQHRWIPHPPKFLKDDSEWYEKLKASCKAN